METARLKIRKHKESAEAVEDEFVLDGGIPYAVVPQDVLKRLGVEPDDTVTFLVGVETVMRRVGNAYVQLGQRGSYSKVIFGEPGDMQQLGVRTLESLGLFLHPLTRELVPLPSMAG